LRAVNCACGLLASILLALLMPSCKFGNVLLLVDPSPGFGFAVERVDNAGWDPRLCQFDIAGPSVLPNDDSVSGLRLGLDMASRPWIANRPRGRSRFDLLLLAEATAGPEAIRDRGRSPSSIATGTRWR
jgi:hypothetical protein